MNLEETKTAKLLHTLKFAKFPNEIRPKAGPSPVSAFARRGCLRDDRWEPKHVSSSIFELNGELVPSLIVEWLADLDIQLEDLGATRFYKSIPSSNHQTQSNGYEGSSDSVIYVCGSRPLRHRASQSFQVPDRRQSTRQVFHLPQKGTCTH